MIDKLIVHPTGVGSAKLRLHPASLDLSQDVMFVTWEVLSNDEQIINRGMVNVTGDDLVQYLKGDVNPETMFKLVIPQLMYTPL